ncbi:hypothetical protein PV328_012044 [Microctonus aethiopoides]|uniref:Uncharacterized protein n=1 Tax=Microctonus aethiopoides TaxID=144406 RepID=A0AA39FH13_9HYME|nr:hypothetical protein PV328_012044 [Microctonus aethiopoides]
MADDKVCNTFPYISDTYSLPFFSNRKYCHVSKSNLSSNSEVKEQKNSLNIAFHPRNSKGISSPNPSTSSNLTFDNTSTNNAIENYNKELVQMHSEDDANSSPTSPAVFSRQQIDENQKENVKMLCSTLGVIKENVQFLQNICNIFKVVPPRHSNQKVLD